MNKSQFNKAELIDFISRTQNIQKNKAEEVVNMFIESILACARMKCRINLIGFGLFSFNDVAERMGRNPQTGESIKIGPYVQPLFKAGKKLKDACNGADLSNNCKL